MATTKKKSAVRTRNTKAKTKTKAKKKGKTVRRKK